jgi:hypothetical protein
VLASATEFRYTVDDEVKPLPESEIVVEGACESIVTGCTDFSWGAGIAPTHSDVPPQEINAIPAVAAIRRTSPAPATRFAIVNSFGTRQCKDIAKNAVTEVTFHSDSCQPNKAVFALNTPVQPF